MRDKKLQVFVSSTFTDLRAERQAAVEAILSSGHIPAGMELFSAGDESQMTVIKRWIDESDVYLLILGGRYGSVEPVSGKSYTHLEYEYALEKGKPLFAVVINQNTLDSKVKEHGVLVIEQESPQKLKEFKAEVLTTLVKFWDDTKDIKLAIHETLSEFNYRKELVGWVRADTTVNAGLLAEEIARLTKENSDLRLELSKSKSASEALYNGFTYEDFKDFLSSREILYNQKKISVLDYITNMGNNLAIAGIPLGGIEVIRVLLSLRLIERFSDFYRFTQSGHNFYLRLQQNKIKKPSTLL